MFSIPKRLLDEKVLVWGLAPRNPHHTRYMFRRYSHVYKSLLSMYPIIVYKLSYDGGLVAVPKRFEVIWEVFLDDILGFEIIRFREETIREHLIDTIETAKAWQRIREPILDLLLKQLKQRR